MISYGHRIGNWRGAQGRRMDKKEGIKEKRTRMTADEKWCRDHRLRARLGKGQGQRKWQRGGELEGKQRIKRGFVCWGSFFQLKAHIFFVNAHNESLEPYGSSSSAVWSARLSGLHNAYRELEFSAIICAELPLYLHNLRLPLVTWQ